MEREGVGCSGTYAEYSTYLDMKRGWLANMPLHGLSSAWMV